MKFVQKPVVVDAIQAREAIHYASSAWADLPPWLSSAYKRCEVIFLPKQVLIRTAQGRTAADIDDWLIYGLSREIQVCKADVFEKTYDRVESESTE